MNFTSDPQITLNQIAKIRACITSLNHVLLTLETENKPTSGKINQVEQVMTALKELEQ